MRSIIAQGILVLNPSAALEHEQATHSYSGHINIRRRLGQSRTNVYVSLMFLLRDRRRRTRSRRLRKIQSSCPDSGTIHRHKKTFKLPTGWLFESAVTDAKRCTLSLPVSVWSHAGQSDTMRLCDCRWRGLSTCLGTAAISTTLELMEKHLYLNLRGW